MEPVDAKKFVIFRECWRIEVDANITVNKIPDNFDSMGFGFEIRNLKI